jgi:hypothetical protein
VSFVSWRDAISYNGPVTTIPCSLLLVLLYVPQSKSTERTTREFIERERTKIVDLFCQNYGIAAALDLYNNNDYYYYMIKDTYQTCFEIIISFDMMFII